MSEEKPKEATEAPATDAPATEAPATDAAPATEVAPAQDGAAAEESKAEAKEEAPAAGDDAKPPANEEESKAEAPAEEAKKGDTPPPEGEVAEGAGEAAAEGDAAADGTPQISPRKQQALDEELARKANIKAVDEFYPSGYSAKTLPDSQISKRNFAFHGVLGMPSMKRYNLHFLTGQEIIYITGNKYQTYNLQTQKKTTFHGRDRDGVGSIAVHP